MRQRKDPSITIKHCAGGSHDGPCDVRSLNAAAEMEVGSQPTEERYFCQKTKYRCRESGGAQPAVREKEAGKGCAALVHVLYHFIFPFSVSHTNIN